MRDSIITRDEVAPGNAHLYCYKVNVQAQHKLQPLEEGGADDYVECQLVGRTRRLWYSQISCSAIRKISAAGVAGCWVYFLS